MRAALVGEGWPPDSPGGLNRYFRALYEHLPSAGVSTRAVVVGPARGAGRGVAVVPAGTFAGRLYRSALAVSRVASRAQVIDVHFALYGAAPVHLPTLRGKPLVVHFHGPWAAESAASGAGPVETWLKRTVESSLFRRADRFIVLSDAFAEVLAGYGVPSTRIRKVRPGVDLQRFKALSPTGRSAARLRLSTDPDAPLVVAVRRLVPRMGLDVLLRAWPDVLRNHPHAILAIVGDGPEREALVAQADREGVLRSLRFVGRAREDELAAWFAAADLAVTPSVSLEGFGLVLLEALASGTPVLASDVGGMREAVGQLGAQHLVPADDVAAWSSALNESISGVRNLVSRTAARSFAEAHAWSATARQVRGVYEEAALARIARTRRDG